MSSRSAMHRSAAILVSAALAVGAAGCGGSDGDGGGGSDGYASTWNDVCQSLTTAQTTLQSDGAAIQKRLGTTNQQEIQKAIAGPTTKLVDSYIAALDKVKGLDAPSEFSSFQDKVDASAPTTKSTLETLKTAAAKADVSAFQQAFSKIDTNNLFPSPPAELKKQATACNAL